mmetsp:Transcript_11619/g.25140  ORF Transcript_11619/g.25140 Transcript_11619/m.25140 type:complete len:358 (+) Transcript_11619:151-1224(+)
MAEFYQCKLIGIRPKERMTFRNAAKDIMTFSILIFVSILIAAADAFSSPKLPQIESFSVTNSPQHNNNNNDNILHNIQNNTIHADAVGNRIPTETQLVLLCLDYLRDLRRSYPDVEDMTHAEGLDGDYVSLAVWALSRAFVRPGKLTLARESAHGDADVDVHGDGHGHGHGDGRADPIRMATQLMSMTVNGDGTLGLAEDGRRRKHKHHNSKEAKVPILAAGGMNGEKAFGNDAWYRQLSFREERELQKGMEEMIETSNSNDNCDEYPDGMMQQHYRRWMTENLENKSVARLSETICIPSIEDITNEVMLRIPIVLSSSPTSPDEEDEDEDEDEYGDCDDDDCDDDIRSLFHGAKPK